MRYKRLRQLANLTLVEVETRTGINISKLSRVENGRSRLSAPEAYLLKSILILEIAARQKAVAR